MAFNDDQTIELPALYTLPYNTTSSLELQDRLDEEFDTLSAFGTADFAILYLPRSQRLVTSRPTKFKTRLTPTVEVVFEEARGDSPVCDAPPAYCEVEARETLPPPPSPAAARRTIAQLAADAAIREMDEDALRPVPAPDEILQRAREQEAAEDAALESFYAKFPALAALRPSPPRMPATGLLTPPPTPPTSRGPKAASRVPSFITMEKKSSTAAPSVHVAPSSSSAFDKRMSTAPPTPVSAPRKPASRIPRKKNKENTIQPAGRKGKTFTVKIDVTVSSSQAEGPSMASGPGKAPTALKVKKRENDSMPTKGRMPASAGKSSSSSYAPSKYGAQPPLDRKTRQHSVVVGRPATHIM
ncbi:hypothetical protein K525DRAFT_289079 [Schizophyllum commune Loenen D]|nr:hypothetical protein K525DRAFT_289079 [Schizophyllum commune Loenen D]